MGRPPILPKKKKDGWYIEVRNKGAKSGMILIRDTEVAMFQAAKQYETTKDVIILGEHRSGKRVDEKKIKKRKSKKCNAQKKRPDEGLFLLPLICSLLRLPELPIFRQEQILAPHPLACLQFVRF